MKGQDLYEGLRYVDPVLLEEAMEPVKRPGWRRYLPAAACVALLLAGTAVAVFHSVEIRMLDVEDPETYEPSRVKLPTGADTVFQVEGQVETTPAEAFSAQLLEDAAAEDRYHTFDTWEEAVAYVGVEASGPEGQSDVTLTLENGQLAEVSLRAGGSSAGFDVADGLAVSYTASFYTEHCTEDRGNRYYFYDLEEEVDQETISVAGGETAQLISSQNQYGGMVCGFLARGQVLYSVDILYLTGQAELAREVLVTILNGI